MWRGHGTQGKSDIEAVAVAGCGGDRGVEKLLLLLLLASSPTCAPLTAPTNCDCGCGWLRLRLRRGSPRVRVGLACRAWTHHGDASLRRIMMMYRENAS